MAKAKKPRWQRRKDDRPGEIIAAALDVFRSRGFAAARLDDVAARAGVSKGTLYLYFRNKEELFKAVVRETLLPNIVLAEEQLQQSDAPTQELLLQVIGAFVGKLGTPVGAIPKLIISEADNFPDLAKFYIEEVIARGLRLIGSLLQRGQERGEFRALDALSAPPMLVAPVMLMALWKHALEPHAPARAKAIFDPERFVATYGDLFLNGLLRRPVEAGE